MYLLLLPDSVRIVFVTFNELGVFKERDFEIFWHMPMCPTQAVAYVRVTVTTLSTKTGF